MKKQIILVAVFSIIIFGFSFVNFVQAIEPIPGIPIGLEGEPSVIGEPIAGVDVKLGTNGGGLMASTDLGIDNVGILPTSRLYFFKELGRGINRLFTWNEVSKAKLELKITNEKAAELLEVRKIKTNDINAIKKALQNYTKAQERLNFRITTINGTSNIVEKQKLLEDVDAKTAKHNALLEEIAGENTNQLRFEVVGETLKQAQDNILKTFTVAVTPVNDEPAMKQKAEEQIKSAGVAIEEANNAMMGVSTTRGITLNPEVNLKVTVPKQTQGATFGEKMKVDDELSIFDRWGNMIAKAKSNLDSAKKAFAEGKYGEAYGQARSAEAMVPVLATGENFPDEKVDVIVPTTPSAETKTEININTNIETPTLTPDSTSSLRIAPTSVGVSEGKGGESSIRQK